VGPCSPDSSGDCERNNRRHGGSANHLSLFAREVSQSSQNSSSRRDGRSSCGSRIYGHHERSRSAILGHILGHNSLFHFH